jgi:hypothetical protein
MAWKLSFQAILRYDRKMVRMPVRLRFEKAVPWLTGLDAQAG